MPDKVHDPLVGFGDLFHPSFCPAVLVNEEAYGLYTLSMFKLDFAHVQVDGILDTEFLQLAVYYHDEHIFLRRRLHSR